MANSIICVLVQVEKINACYHCAIELVTGIKMTKVLLVEVEACIYFNEIITHSGNPNNLRLKGSQSLLTHEF